MRLEWINLVLSAHSSWEALHPPSLTWEPGLTEYTSVRHPIQNLENLGFFYNLINILIAHINESQCDISMHVNCMQ